MKTILLTGFEPFNGETINPSLEALGFLKASPIAGVRLETAAIPCVFGGGLDAMRAAIKRFSPDAVIAVGQAGGRPGFSVERIAVNLIDAPYPDNAGAEPVDEEIVEGGPAAYFSTLPVRAIKDRLREAGLPAGLSLTAGPFVCNYLFYGLRHMIETEGPAIPAGFIHVPFLMEQAARHPGRPGMELETIVRGLRLAVAVVRDGI